MCGTGQAHGANAGHRASRTSATNHCYFELGGTQRGVLLVSSMSIVRLYAGLYAVMLGDAVCLGNMHTMCLLLIRTFITCCFDATIGRMLEPHALQCTGIK